MNNFSNFIVTDLGVSHTETCFTDRELSPLLVLQSISVLGNSRERILLSFPNFGVAYCSNNRSWSFSPPFPKSTITQFSLSKNTEKKGIMEIA